MLARRDYSQSELARKLRAKGYAYDDIQIVTMDLIQKGLLNEQRYAENFVYSRRHKGYGPERIARELQTHGLADEAIAEHIKITDNDWLSEAHTAWKKRFKGNLPNNFKDRAKQMRFLQYRGFTREQIIHVLRGEDDTE